MKQLRDYPFFVRLREKSAEKRAKFFKEMEARYLAFEDQLFISVDKFFRFIGYYKKKYLPTPIYRLQKKSRRYFRTFVLKEMSGTDKVIMFMDISFITFMVFMESYEFEYWGTEWFIAAFYLLFIVVMIELATTQLRWFFNFEPFLRKVWGHINTWKARFAALEAKRAKAYPEFIMTKKGIVPTFPHKDEIWK